MLDENEQDSKDQPDDGQTENATAKASVKLCPKDASPSDREEDHPCKQPKEQCQKDPLVPVKTLPMGHDLLIIQRSTECKHQALPCGDAIEEVMFCICADHLMQILEPRRRQEQKKR